MFAFVRLVAFVTLIVATLAAAGAALVAVSVAALTALAPPGGPGLPAARTPAADEGYAGVTGDRLVSRPLGSRQEAEHLAAEPALRGARPEVVGPDPAGRWFVAIGP
jgi:hypothetical protein